MEENLKEYNEFEEGDEQDGEEEQVGILMPGIEDATDIFSPWCYTHYELSLKIFFFKKKKLFFCSLHLFCLFKLDLFGLVDLTCLIGRCVDNLWPSFHW